MSDIRNKIIKLLEESKISFMEDIEVQPDLFGGEDTYYKDGQQALSFTDVLECMSEIAPDLGFVDQKEFDGLYWMVFDSGKPFDFESIKGKLKERFGDNVVVRLAQSQYSPEQKKLYIGFVDVADVEDDGIEEAAGLLKKGQRVRIKDTAEDFPGEEGVIVAVRSTAMSGTPFYSVKLDSGEPYDVVADQVEPALEEDNQRGTGTYKLQNGNGYYDVVYADGKYYVQQYIRDVNGKRRDIGNQKILNELPNDFEYVGLEEGWKDNLKKGVATLGVAGALAGNAMAHDPMYDGATRPFDDTNMTVQQVQQLSDEEDKATVLPNGMIKDQYGNEWTKEDWERLMRGEDPFADNDDVHEAVDETNNVKNKKLLDLLTRGTINVLNDDAIELKIDEVSGLLSDCYEVEVYDFAKSKEPVWRGWVDHNLIANISNGEPLFDDVHGED